MCDNINEIKIIGKVTSEMVWKLFTKLADTTNEEFPTQDFNKEITILRKKYNRNKIEGTWFTWFDEQDSRTLQNIYQDLLNIQHKYSIQEQELFSKDWWTNSLEEIQLIPKVQIKNNINYAKIDTDIEYLLQQYKNPEISYHDAEKSYIAMGGNYRDFVKEKMHPYYEGIRKDLLERYEVLAEKKYENTHEEKLEFGGKIGSPLKGRYYIHDKMGNIAKWLGKSTKLKWVQDFIEALGLDTAEAETYNCRELNDALDLHDGQFSHGGTNPKFSVIYFEYNGTPVLIYIQINKFFDAKKEIYTPNGFMESGKLKSLLYDEPSKIHDIKELLELDKPLNEIRITNATPEKVIKLSLSSKDPRFWKNDDIMNYFHSENKISKIYSNATVKIDFNFDTWVKLLPLDELDELYRDLKQLDQSEKYLEEIKIVRAPKTWNLDEPGIDATKIQPRDILQFTLEDIGEGENNIVQQQVDHINQQVDTMWVVRDLPKVGLPYGDGGWDYWMFDSIENYYKKHLKEIKINNITEQKNKSNRIDLIKQFINFSWNELGVNKKDRCKIILTNDKSKTETYAHYFPGKEIVVYIKGRSVGDCCRSISHEQKHHEQYLKGLLKDDSGNTGSDIENEANAFAGIVMRKWGKQHPEIFTEIKIIKGKVDTSNPTINTYVYTKENSDIFKVDNLVDMVELGSYLTIIPGGNDKLILFPKENFHLERANSYDYNQKNKDFIINYVIEKVKQGKIHFYKNGDILDEIKLYSKQDVNKITPELMFNIIDKITSVSGEISAEEWDKWYDNVYTKYIDSQNTDLLLMSILNKLNQNTLFQLYQDTIEMFPRLKSITEIKIIKKITPEQIRLLLLEPDNSFKSKYDSIIWKWINKLHVIGKGNKWIDDLDPSQLSQLYNDLIDINEIKLKSSKEIKSITAKDINNALMRLIINGHIDKFRELAAQIKAKFGLEATNLAKSIEAQNPEVLFQIWQDVQQCYKDNKLNEIKIISKINAEIVISLIEFVDGQKKGNFDKTTNIINKHGYNSATYNGDGWRSWIKEQPQQILSQIYNDVLQLKSLNEIRIIGKVPSLFNIWNGSHKELYIGHENVLNYGLSQNPLFSEDDVDNIIITWIQEYEDEYTTDVKNIKKWDIKLFGFINNYIDKTYNRINEIRIVPPEKSFSTESFSQLRTQLKMVLGDNLINLDEYKIEHPEEAKEIYNDNPYFGYGSYYSDYVSFNFYVEPLDESNIEKINGVIESFKAKHRFVGTPSYQVDRVPNVWCTLSKEIIKTGPGERPIGEVFSKDWWTNSLEEIQMIPKVTPETISKILTKISLKLQDRGIAEQSDERELNKITNKYFGWSWYNIDMDDIQKLDQLSLNNLYQEIKNII